MSNPMKKYAHIFLFWSFEFISDFEFRYSDLNRKYFQILPLRSLLRPPALWEELSLFLRTYN